MNSKFPSSSNKNLKPLLLCEGLKENDFFIILTFLSFVFLTVAYSQFCIYISVITDVPILTMYTFSYSNPTCFFIKPSNRERLKQIDRLMTKITKKNQNVKYIHSITTKNQNEFRDFQYFRPQGIRLESDQVRLQSFKNHQK